jgi:hypothetical protein
MQSRYCFGIQDICFVTGHFLERMLRKSDTMTSQAIVSYYFATFLLPHTLFVFLSTDINNDRRVKLFGGTALIVQLVSTSWPGELCQNKN